MTMSPSNAVMSNCEFRKLVPRLGHITNMQQAGWGTSFVEATQLIALALLNLFLELTVVHSGLRSTPCCHSEQQPAL